MSDKTSDKRRVPMNDQRSTREQLADLVVLADRHGLYDAADLIRALLRR